MIEQRARAGDFDDLTADYERFRIGYSTELYDVLGSLGWRCGEHVLDAGCGTGLSAAPLLERGLRVTGLDPSRKMLASAKRVLPNATFVPGTVEALPFGAATFDAAISAQSFHWFDRDRAFSELLRVVKPGAPIAVWWKVLGSDDGLRAIRAAACSRVGVEPAPEPVRGGFGAFYRAPFANRTLRVLPFQARVSVDGWIGYERSRAVARNCYADRCGAYVAAVETELCDKYGSRTALMDVRYTQFLYVGFKP